MTKIFWKNKFDYSVDVCVKLNAEIENDMAMPVEFRNKQTGKTKVVNTDDNGRVCTKVTPGSYLVSVSQLISLLFLSHTVRTISISKIVFQSKI